MGDFKATPGPWEAVPAGADGYCGDTGRYHIEERGTDAQWVIAATVGNVNALKADEWANAQLIASAPDLLAACRWAESALAPFSKDPQKKSGMALLRAALAKARGEHPQATDSKEADRG
ncbi:hypothetical protein [Sphingomonas sp.]|uniref:hypothetical protein n=1 Tax=Sphingomonas sp. TaxID=28214 RepID=UPI0031D7C1DD